MSARGTSLPPRSLPPRRAPPRRSEGNDTVRSWLQSVGAPVVQAVATDEPVPSLEDLLTLGLQLAHADASLARTLPVVLWRNRARLRLEELSRAARAAGEGAALGFFLDLTAELAADRELAKAAASLEDARSPALTFFFTGAGDTLVGKELAERRTPTVARRWRFLMNMPFASFETLYRKHVGRHEQ